jgi:hypothetical protein
LFANAATASGASTAASNTPAAYGAQAATESVISRWHGYALASITPQFSWAVLPETYAPPRVLDAYVDVPVRANPFKMQGESRTRIGVSIATEHVSDTPVVMPNQPAHLVDVPQSGLQRTVVTPSLAQTWGDRGTLRLTGVLAYQRFATLGMGTATASWTPPPSWASNSSYGVGGRFDLGNSIGEHWRWDIGYQSRVGMGVFANYRGVFSDRGDFDIPASATATLGYAVTPEFGVDIGVQRVQYSAITPFTSSGLPTRFLALLGDGSSPVFRWSDLNVYSIGWSLHNDTVGNVQLRYTTRQQPVPTSRLLENALASATANDMVSLGWSRQFGANSNLSMTASYATSPYYLLMPTYTQRADSIASQFEFEALWSVRF